VPTPVEPPATGWRLPDIRDLSPDEDGHDLLAVGADLAPGTLLAAYRSGLFPMHVTLPEGPESDEPEPQAATLQIGWWSPDPRGIIPLTGLHISRSLRSSVNRFDCTIDRAFGAVVSGCSDRGRPDGWINEDIAAAYERLHDLGWAHSVEVWQNRELVGGLYGVAIGGLFAGESMFHCVRDASKVALVHLVGTLSCDGIDRLLDVQWVTPHLSSLGAVAVARRQYRARLDRALAMPPPPVWTGTE
jgi:leucyl/phenylalanyl-tRNA---protein transferase